MDNQELISKLDELINDNINYCDFYIALKTFKKEYKKSMFYKQTKMPLYRLIKKYQEYKLMNLDLVFNLIQDRINALDVSKFTQVLNQFEDALAVDLENNQAALDQVADLSKNLSQYNSEYRGK